MMSMTRTTNGRWRIRRKSFHNSHQLFTLSSTRSSSLGIINASLLGLLPPRILVTIVLGSLLTLTGGVGAMQSPAISPSSSASPSSSSNYQTVDAISALTGLSNGYMATYYHQLGNADDDQHHQYPQQQEKFHGYHNVHPQLLHNPEVVDKEPTGRGLNLHTSHYGNGPGVMGHSNMATGINAKASASSSSPPSLEIVNVANGGGFIPTTLSAAGQHYASTLLDLQSPTDKNKLQPPGGGDVPKMGKQQATTTAYQHNLAPSSSNGPTSLYGRLSNYDEQQMQLSARSGAAAAYAGGGDSNSGYQRSSVGGESGHNFGEAYDNYAANLYHDSNTNEGEQQQNFANYFTRTTTSALTDNGEAYGTTGVDENVGVGQNPHKYLPLNNYQQQQNEHQSYPLHDYQQQDKQTIYTRAASSATAPPSSATVTSSQFFGNYNYPNNVDDDNKELVMANYQMWNLVDKQLASNYYGSQNQEQHQNHQHHQQQQQQHNSETEQQYREANSKQQYQQNSQTAIKQRQFKQDEDDNDIGPGEYTDSDTAESHFRLKARNEKTFRTKSKRSEPQNEHYDDSYTPEHYRHSTSSENTAVETIQIQQQQLDELHDQLQKQQQQFIALQHQLIDHDQRLQIQRTQAQYHHSASHPTLPPITQTIHHNPHSLQALSGTPLSQHTHIVRNIPIIQRQQVYVPTKETVNVEVPDPIINTVKTPVAIEIPVPKTVAVPQLNEVKIPIERVKPFPVERPIPFLVEKRVPYAVEKQIAQPVYYNVPIKVPIVHTVVHKLHSPHAYSYQHQKHHHGPIHYSGHIRHPIHHNHHHGVHHGHLHYSGGHYMK
ncbi:uncharacterized protein LOC142219656 [Haematobia irritans]|uniref:uncharacterized protein LOC142219656 n=1 Tax=Haematobia irritans TaxID=7368 RepID=UPI003F4FD266